MPAFAPKTGCVGRYGTCFGALVKLRGEVQDGNPPAARLSPARVKGVYREIWIWDNLPHRSAMWMHTRRPPLPGAYALMVTLIVLGCGVQAARAQNPRGTLRGVVQDASGAVIPNAVISLRAKESSIERTAVSGARGEFRVEDLPSGEYSLVVQASGFAEGRADVKIVVAQVRDVSIALQP